MRHDSMLEIISGLPILHAILNMSKFHIKVLVLKIFDEKYTFLFTFTLWEPLQNLTYTSLQLMQTLKHKNMPNGKTRKTLSSEVQILENATHDMQ